MAGITAWGNVLVADTARLLAPEEIERRRRLQRQALRGSRRALEALRFGVEGIPGLTELVLQGEELIHAGQIVGGRR